MIFHLSYHSIERILFHLVFVCNFVYFQILTINPVTDTIQERITKEMVINMEAMERGDLQEKKVHGTKTFPCSLYRSEGNKERLIVKHHWHKEIELLYFMKGKYHIEINMDKYDIEEECICFINSGELHFICSDSAFAEHAVLFYPGMLLFEETDKFQKHVLLPLVENKVTLPRFIKRGEEAFIMVRNEILQIEQAILRGLPHGPGPGRASMETSEDMAEQLLVKASLLRMIGLLKKYNMIYGEPEKTDYRVEVIKGVLTFIQKNYENKIYVRDLAKIANMNEQYFCRFFKKRIGRSPMEYVNEYRIKQAKKLLANTDLPVTDVSLECGFNNLGNFMREFKKAAKTTPLKYRKNEMGS